MDLEKFVELNNRVVAYCDNCCRHRNIDDLELDDDQVFGLCNECEEVVYVSEKDLIGSEG